MSLSLITTQFTYKVPKKHHLSNKEMHIHNVYVILYILVNR